MRRIRIMLFVAVTFAWALQFVMPFVASAEQAAKPRLSDVVARAFAATHDGWSSDEVILNDELNAAFIAECRKTLPDASALDLNWALMNARKAGKLNSPATRRRTVRDDEYVHAAEIAARFMFDKHRASTDRVMCDPKLRAEFDAVAQAAAPDVKPELLRRAAFGLRKARRLRPELVARVADWNRRIESHSAAELVKDPSKIPVKPGVYIFRDLTGYLYVGESSNLRERLTKHLDHSDRKSLAQYLWKNGMDDVTVEIHAFDPNSGGARTDMRRAYESELIASRKPRLNIAP